MNVGSLFSGIGGFDYGLGRRVLAERWPGVPCYPDVRELAGASVAPVDVLCGGFPCQDISLAGKGAGIDGARSGLWSEYARLVGELRPRYVIVENVAALLTRGLGRVLGDLAALGYDAEWDCLPASAFGAPHRRDRLWIVAYSNGGGWIKGKPDLQAWESDAQGRGTGPGAVADADSAGRETWSSDGMGVEPGSVVGQPPRQGGSSSMADPEGEPLRPGLRACESRGERRGRPGDSGGAGEFQDADECAVQPWRIGGRTTQAGGSEWWSVEPPVGRVAHGVPDRLAQLAAYGNALVPQIAEWLGTQILGYERGRLAA